MFIEYLSQAPYPLVQRRLPDHLLIANDEPNYKVIIPEAYEKFKKVPDVVKQTDLVFATILSKKLGNDIYLKREDTQKVFSFKIRGAYNSMSNLQTGIKGVATASAGNHAQGVALSSACLNIKAVIVMPIGTPSIKVDSVKHFGGDLVDVRILGKDFDEAKAQCDKIVQEEKLIYIPPFDDPYVIAGQGTIGIEILEKIPNPDAVFVQIGGGGLAAGVSEHIKGKDNPPPNTKVIGVEGVGQDAMAKSLAAGHPFALEQVDPFADGTAVKIPGNETFRVCQKRLDPEIILVSNDEICAAIKDIFDDTRCVVEPSGALSLAGLKRYIVDKKYVGKKFVAVISGANMNFIRLRFVAERAELGEGREALLSISYPKRSDVGELYKTINRNVTEYLYRYDASGKRSYVMLSFNVKEGSVPSDDVQEVLKALNKTGDRAQDISDNGLAKNHVRYMVGGAEHVENERIFRFGFPGRPSSFPTFIGELDKCWNISMFNYRNHGDDVGKVLIGFQVPPGDKEKFDAFLEKLKKNHFTCSEETENLVYKEFLWEYSCGQVKPTYFAQLKSRLRKWSGTFLKG